MPNTLNKDRIRLLVEALRSGEYEQGQSYLERADKRAANGRLRHCCLGVGCRVAMANGVALQTEAITGPFGTTTRFGDEFDSNTAFLPITIKDWYGFEDVSPNLRLEDGRVVPAVTANDGVQLNFAKIADAFERTYLND